jgi:hypothetical protein
MTPAERLKQTQKTSVKNLAQEFVQSYNLDIQPQLESSPFAFHDAGHRFANIPATIYGELLQNVHDKATFDKLYGSGAIHGNPLSYSEFPKGNSSFVNYGSIGDAEQHELYKQDLLQRGIPPSAFEPGGEASWDASSYLNIWICNTVSGLLGYSSPVGAAADKDGIVIRFNAFGTRGNVTAPFHLGRTAVHEVGHWLNLKHLWGDGECGSDEVDDTPAQRTYNRGIPSFHLVSTACSSSTANGVMFMNFMDFTDDAGMMMFTNGQVSRMRNLFQTGGLRNSILSSKALGKPWITNPVETVSNISADVIAMQVKLYPNPASSFIMLELTNPISIEKGYNIYAADGRKVAQGAINVENNRINIQSLNAGIYFVKVGERMVRFVKN